MPLRYHWYVLLEFAIKLLESLVIVGFRENHTFPTVYIIDLLGHPEVPKPVT